MLVSRPILVPGSSCSKDGSEFGADEELERGVKL